MSPIKLKTLKKGSSIRLTKKCKDFFYQEAFTLCVSNGVLKSEKDADEYLIRRALGANIPYTANILELRNNVPVALVQIKVGNLITETILSHKEII
jgi:hypothetical protein